MLGEEIRWAQACPGTQCEQLAAADEARVGGVRAREAGHQPLGAQVRDVQPRIDMLRTRVDGYDFGIASSEASLELLRLEAAEAKRPAAGG